MILRSKIPLSGQHAVVLGRSSIVGKPLALMLLSHDATVTICHSKTRNLSEFLKNADIVLSAVGKPGIVMASMVKPGAAVIDIGINRLANGQLCGDVDYNNVQEIAKWITPVPGGVGPVTVAMVIANTILATESQHKLF
jgi:methylenetetrahydrofolate dehydrogenase (NADP+)/methenyltetrahydrofolate cyclohydrolase